MAENLTASRQRRRGRLWKNNVANRGTDIQHHVLDAEFRWDDPVVSTEILVTHFLTTTLEQHHRILTLLFGVHFSHAVILG